MISNSINEKNGDILNSITITNRKSKVTEKLSFCEILPFEHPKYQIASPMLVGQNGAPVGVRSRIQTDFSFNITATDDEARDKIEQQLLRLQLLPPNASIGVFDILHPQLTAAKILSFQLISITQPPWKFGAMKWLFKCREATKIVPMVKPDTSIFSEAEKNGVVTPAAVRITRGGLKKK